MGLFQRAAETYDAHARYVGLIREGHQPLAPIGHTLTSAQLEITLDEAGNFCSGRAVDKSEPKIIIPVTEESAGRTSSACAHPLCDNLGYVSPVDPKKHGLYLTQLSDWAFSRYTHPKLTAILRYVEAGTVLQDLSGEELIRLKDDGTPEDEKLFVRWRVIGTPETVTPNCWEDTTLFDSFIRWYDARTVSARRALCMVSGQEERISSQHPKGVIPINGNAKLISANDTSGFTYRGRFAEDWEAAEIGYTPSQKAHNALRWLAAEQGAVYGGRTFLCWNPQGKEVRHAAGPFARFAQRITEPTEYRESLQKTLAGYQTALTPTDGVVIAAFDAATTGRLAMTYYGELTGSDFLQRLYEWDLHCSWKDYRFGVQSPPLYQIVGCAFGTQRTGTGKARMETDDRVMRQQIQRLVSCRVDRAMMPVDIMRALADRASTPQAYEKDVWETIVSTACAVIRKYRYDRYREEWEMALDPNKNDRSYQFGRLLAVMEKVELDTYRDGGRDTRETNAIRLLSMFRQRPMTAANTIHTQLERAYFSRLTPGLTAWYKSLISSIMEQISSFPDSDWDKPLSETYLMGYYLQRSDFYKGKTEEEKENEA